MLVRVQPIQAGRHFAHNANSRREFQNVVVEWLTLLPRIREAPGSNIGQETGHPH
jgi:hypothetical protein